jgi:sialate O-acetylesterase
MKKLTVAILGIIFGITSLKAEVVLPKLLSDNMVLQRDLQVNIWGWAGKGEGISVTIADQKLTAKADENGNWKVQLKPLKAGGPYEMKIKGTNEIVLKNILVGDVWVCSGQSNMEFMLSQANNADEEIAAANFPQIRLFSLDKRISEKPLPNASSNGWEICSPATAGAFSAVGYFFGRNLYSHLNIPIGLINSSWGGTNIEAWTSMETMYSLPEYRLALDNLKKNNFSKNDQDINILRDVWFKKTETDDSGRIQKWQLPETKFSKWDEMKLPQYWEKAGLPDLDGVVWFEKRIELSAQEAENGINLSLTKIDDNDQTFVNGNLVGETNNYNALRKYPVPAKFLKAGKNLLVVRVIDYGWGGGIYGNAKELYFETGTTKKSLAGNWKYKVGINLPSPYPTMSPNEYPSSLYNGMISPLTNFGIKGTIWYQGEANVKDAIKYRVLLPNMITDWRKNWKQPDFPFLIVQLANFDAAASNDDGDWPNLRESQAITASTVPNTGLAVISDIGEAKDIHPKNKQDVGYRLYLAARKVAYGEDLIYSGPVYKSMKIDGSKIVAEFNNTGSGLVVKDKYGYVKGFAVAGADKKYVWAKAYLTPESNIVIYSDSVKNPVAVRYAWDNNPEDANLYNKENLPAVPFRTDTW